MKENKKPLVSIIMPNYNNGNYIEEAINSVLNQSYKNYELIIIDDNSNDNSLFVISKFLHNKNIKLIKFNINYGAAKARLEGIKYSEGKYIAFLDSDDFWQKDKLLFQINFMMDNNIEFSYTNYFTFIDTNIIKENKFKASINYNDLLLNSPGNSTVILEKKICEKINTPLLKKRNDYIFFLSAIKISKIAFGINKPLSYYRLNKNGLSHNKFRLLKYHWFIYRRVEKLSFLRSLLILIYIIIRKIF